MCSSFAVNVRTHPTGFGPVVFRITNWHNWSPEGETEKKLQLKEVMKMAKDAGSLVMKLPKVVVVDGRETAVTSMYLTILASQGNNCRVEKVINLCKDLSISSCPLLFVWAFRNSNVVTSLLTMRSRNK